MIEVCDKCYECKYFEHDYWNCQGSTEPCHEFIEGKRMDTLYKYEEDEYGDDTDIAFNKDLSK